MSASPVSQLIPVIVIVFLLVWITVRRTYAIATGTPYREARLFGLVGIWTLFFALFGASTLDLALAAWGDLALVLVAPYAGIVVAAALLAAPRVQRLATFERRADGQLYYRLPAFVPVISTALFLVRLTAEIVLFGVTAFSSFTPPSNVSAGSLFVLIAFDLLYGGSVGLLIGRALGVRAGFRASQAAPLPSP